MEFNLYQQILQNLPVSYALVDSNGKFIDCNKILCEISGYEREELLNHNLFEFGGYFNKDLIQGMFSETIANGTAEARMDLYNRHSQIFHVDVKMQHMKLDETDLIGILIYNSTQEEEINKQLQINNSIFLELIDNSHRALFIEDNQGIIQYMNKKLLVFMGIPVEPAEVVGKPKSVLINVILSNVTNPEAYQKFIDTSIENQLGVVDFDIEFKDGRFFRLAYEPVYHENILSAHLWFFNDITSEMTAKREVENQRVFYDQVIQEMPVESIILSTENFQLLHINDLAVKNQSLDNWEKGMSLEAYLQNVTGLAGQQLNEKALRFRKCIDSKSALQFMDITTDALGNEHYYKRFITPYFRGEALYLISEFSVDLTDLKMVEKELMGTQKQLLSLIETQKAHIWSVDSNKCFQQSNDTFKEVLLESFGIDIQEGFFMPDSFVNPIMREEWSGYYDRVLAGETFSVTRTYPLPVDGFTMEYTFKPIFDNEKHIIGASVFGYDLTDLNQAQEQLQEVHSSLRSLIDTSRAMIWSVDSNLNITYSNQLFKELTIDTNENELSFGTPAFIGTSNEKQLLFLKHQYERALEGETITVPYFEISDGRVFEYTFKPIFNEENLVLGVSVIAFNISALIQANKLLEQSESNLKALVSSLDDIVFELDEEGRFLNVWTSNESLLALPKDKFLGKSLDEISIPGLHAEVYDLIINAKKDQTTRYYDYPLGERNYQAKISPIILHGKVTGVSILAKDITEKKQQELLLLESEAKFRLISEQMIDMVFVMDFTGEFIYLSPSTRQLLGYEPDELIGKSCFSIVMADDIDAMNDVIGNITPAHPTGVVEVRIKRLDGTLVYAESKIKLVTENPDKPVLQVVTRDISVRKMAEESIQNSIEKEKALILMKSRLVSTVSHEFKTPMSTIRSSAELIELYLNKDPKAYTDRIITHIRVITDEIDRINKLMNDVLLLMKEDANLKGPKKEVIDLQVMCNKIINTNFVDVNGVSRVKFEIKTTETLVEADPTHITYSLFNLINNAIKYSKDEDEVKLTIDGNKHTIQMTITDHGIGIPPEDIQYLFTSFFRASNTEKYPGTGLGLVIVKTFIEKNGGKVSLTSELHKGTIATIQLNRYQPS